jgi:hypothetical protein
MSARSEPDAGDITFTQLDPKKHHGESGWFRLNDPPVDIRLIEVDGRVRIVTVQNNHGLDATTLRMIPMGAIEARANVDGPAPGTWGYARPRIRIQQANRAMAKIVIPTTKPYGDQFFQQVAEAYKRCVSAGLSPGPTIAKAKGVPVSQVHGWVRVARLKGLLGAGRIGKTG